MKLSKSEENYLKTIYSLDMLHETSAVSTSSIAKKIATKASSVTDMIQKLALKKLVNYTKYKGATLTNLGKIIAVKIIRKHRLWEVFLVEKLHYSWYEVHEIAEQLEHIQSPLLTDRLDEFLGHPAFDPHGDPIPDKEGNIAEHKNLLSSLCPNESCILTGIKDANSSLLKYLDRIQIKLGNTLTVISTEVFDNSMTIHYSKKTISISHQISNNLFVKKIKL